MSSVLLLSAAQLRRRRRTTTTATTLHHRYRGCYISTLPLSRILECTSSASSVLPLQAPLPLFIHQNPLQPFEHLPFTAAINHVHQLESFMSPAERLFTMVDVDPRKRVTEALVDLSAVFLDDGAAKWSPRHQQHNFLQFFAEYEHCGFAPWRQYARQVAKWLRQQQQTDQPPATAAEEVVKENLQWFGVSADECEATIRAMMLEMRGFAGMFHRLEQRHPTDHPNVRLIDFVAVHSTLLRSSMQSMARSYGWNGTTPIDVWMSGVPKHRVVDTDHHHRADEHPSAIAYVDQSADRRDQLESDYLHTLCHAIGAKRPVDHLDHRPAFQLFTCIDDRCGSFRRYVEDANPGATESFGVAGFFGLPFRYVPADGRTPGIQAPDRSTPDAVLREVPIHNNGGSRRRMRRAMARFRVAWERASFSPLAALILSSPLFAPVSLLRLAIMGYSPAVSRRLRNFIQSYNRVPNDYELPFSADEAATLLARTFKDTGVHERFAPLIIVLGHCSTSVNNPYASAYNCGACGGREGGPNARLMARLANSPAVRQRLRDVHQIVVPDDTRFIGGMHNTTTDTVEYYDVTDDDVAAIPGFAAARAAIEQACGFNALERCKRFLLASNVRTTHAALHHVSNRAADLAEVRPELNHATNAAVVIGRRDLTKRRFLDRRVFLPSYDPFSDDDRGTNLERVMAPALVVCSGINLEYLFSTTMHHHAAGTKAPLNIVGNIGVLQGTNGDLRAGLPSQMTEMHTPIRCLYVIDAPVSRVDAVLNRRVELRNLVRNEWVHLVIREPSTGAFYRQRDGQYEVYDEHMDVDTVVPFTPHQRHGMEITRRENVAYYVATVATVLACVLPVYFFGATAMNATTGTVIAVCGSALTLPVLAFARRYLHGEYMFSRFAVLCVGLVLGFNLVAVAPTLMHALLGWSLFGFASTFLIGAYNERPSVRNNAMYAFAAYQISDAALLVAVSDGGAGALTAAGLIVAALFKSSQFPLTSLFVRSMEGPTPASALGYAGLSAHVGVVLLASTMPFWFPFDWARLCVAMVGGVTAVYSSLVSKVRADRKGAIANATSAHIGIIYIVLALGYANSALLLSLGHAAFRIVQVLRSPSVLADMQEVQAALGGGSTNSRQVPAWLYRIAWACNRFHSDFHLLHLLQTITRRIRARPWKLSKYEQWGLTALIVIVAGVPFTPLSYYKEEWLIEMLPDHPWLAGAVMLTHFVVSVIIMRVLFMNVLDARRFRKKAHPSGRNPLPPKATSE